MSCPTSSFYLRPTEVVARELVGKRLVRIVKIRDRIFRLAGKIVETEAYGHINDPSSHAYNGITRRNAIMFGNVGRAYVYFIYGNHYCINVSARAKDVMAGAILIRAIEPVEGIEIMTMYRKTKDLFSLTSGPGKLTQALNINSSLNGIDMTNPNSLLHIEFGQDSSKIIATPRVGITKAADRNWRFIDPSSPFISRNTTTKLKNDDYAVN